MNEPPTRLSPLSSEAETQRKYYAQTVIDYDYIFGHIFQGSRELFTIGKIL